MDNYVGKQQMLLRFVNVAYIYINKKIQSFFTDKYVSEHNASSDYMKKQSNKNMFVLLFIYMITSNSVV